MRVVSVDFMRTIAIVAVISIHTVPFSKPGLPVGNVIDSALLINQVSRFAVPFFFVISGYFWASKFSDNQMLVEASFGMAKKILLIFSFWSVVYLLPVDLAMVLDKSLLEILRLFYWNFIAALNKPLATILHGTWIHLWFLSSLFFAVVVSAAFIFFNSERLLVISAVVLYFAGLLGKAYVDSPLGIRTEFDFRDGPFFSLPLFVAGYFIHRRFSGGNLLLKGVVLMVGGFVFQIIEVTQIHRLWGTAMAHDYVLGTFFFGIGSAFVALSGARWLSGRAVGSIGPFVLGIYASHIFFVETLKPLDRALSGNVVWEVAYLSSVFLLSCLVTVLLANFRFTRKAVM